MLIKYYANRHRAMDVHYMRGAYQSTHGWWDERA